jgi:two-component system, OmpR family, response regulator ArlR
MRILIVEDEIRLSEALEEILKKEKYTVDTALDGESGLYDALTGIYDLILLDIMLPKIDGIAVLRRIREKGISTPVIMLTAKGSVG